MPDHHSTFADLGLKPVVVHALRRSGVESPFPIQTAVVQDALAGSDILGRAPTGSGKTLAFGLPLLQRLSGGSSRPSRPRSVILAPTRELALQIEKALDEAALALGVRVAAVVGGVPVRRQAERLARGVDVVVATPGRLDDLAARGFVDLSSVTISVVDEADRMADLGFLPQVVSVLDRTDSTGQRMLFSATLDGDVDDLIRRYLRSPVTHTVDVLPIAERTARHHFFRVVGSEKESVVASIASRDGRTMLFVRTKFAVDRLTESLRSVGVNAAGLHGDKTQANRIRTLASFEAGHVPVLVATDVMARGIHVDSVSVVVHVDPPADAKEYTHRAGRTARAGASGVVVT
ncbi:MAG: DEAD/DEAH box helicase, partial [Rhodococcus fascians]